MDIFNVHIISIINFADLWPVTMLYTCVMTIVCLYFLAIAGDDMVISGEV